MALAARMEEEKERRAAEEDEERKRVRRWPCWPCGCWLRRGCGR